MDIESILNGHTKYDNASFEFSKGSYATWTYDVTLLHQGTNNLGTTFITGGGTLPWIDTLNNDSGITGKGIINPISKSIEVGVFAQTPLQIRSEAHYIDSKNGHDSIVISYFDYQFEGFSFEDSLNRNFAFYPYDKTIALSPYYHWTGNCDIVKFSPMKFSSEVRNTNAAKSDENIIPCLNIFPNPSRNHVTVRIMQDESRSIQLTLCNSLGQEVMKPLDLLTSKSGNSLSLNLTHLPNGTYTLILHEGRSIVKKEIILVK